MPIDEIRSVLDADDPAIVRRHLELHRERLAERLDEQRRLVGGIEEILLQGAEGHATVERTSISRAAKPSASLADPPWSPGKSTGSVPSSTARARALRAGT